MKEFLLILLLALSLRSSGASAQTASIAVLKANVLYLGLNNTVKAVAARYSCQNIVVSTDNGTIEKTGDCEYLVNPEKVGKATILIKSRKGKILGGSIFRVKQIPLATAEVASLQKGYIPAGVLSAQIGISAAIRNMPISFRVSVVHYSMIVIGKDGNCRYFRRADGPYFTDTIKSTLAKVKPGDRVIFFEIVAIGPDRVPRELGLIELDVE